MPEQVYRHRRVLSNLVIECEGSFELVRTTQRNRALTPILRQLCGFLREGSACNQNENFYHKDKSLSKISTYHNETFLIKVFWELAGIKL